MTVDLSVSTLCRAARLPVLPMSGAHLLTGGPTSAKARQDLTDAKLRDLQPRERMYKVSDGGNGLYGVVSPTGSPGPSEMTTGWLAAA